MIETELVLGEDEDVTSPPPPVPLPLDARHLYLLFFLVGLMSNFSTLAEQTWLFRFSIGQIYYIQLILDIAWGPVSVPIGYLSDRASATHRTQIVVMIGAAALLWAIIASVCDSAEPMLVVVMIGLADMGPAVTHVILHGIKVHVFKEYAANTTNRCELWMVLGDFLGQAAASVVLQLAGYRAVFWVYAGVMWIVAFTVVIYVRVPGYEATRKAASLSLSSVWAECKSMSLPPMCSFMFVLSLIPDDSSSMFFYFAYGPMGISPVTMGFLTALGVLVTAVCTVVQPLLTSPKYRALAAVNTLAVYLATVFTMRLHAPWVPDVVVLSVITVLRTFFTKSAELGYTNHVTESVNSNMETFQYTLYMKIPYLGRLMRLVIESLAAHWLGVDHDNFGLLPEIMLGFTLGSLVPALHVMSTVINR